jgi:tetratricopeptide (TPR) repeat protein
MNLNVRGCGTLKNSVPILFRSALAGMVLMSLAACTGLEFSGTRIGPARPLTVSAALGRVDSRRDASLRLVIEGLDEDTAGRPARALASYQRAVRVDSTNPFAYLALARHHLESASPEEASAFLDQARSFFESDQGLGSRVDVWGIGLRAGIDRQLGHHDQANSRFELARRLSPEIWDDERLSSAELR